MQEKINRLEKEINENEEKYQEILNKAIPVKQKIAEEIILLLQSKYKTDTEYMVKTKTSITNSLGLEKLKLLKFEMNLLIDGVVNEKEKILVSPLWSVNTTFIDSLFSRNGNNYGIKNNEERNISSNISEVIRNQYSKLGKILLKYGYIKLENDTSWSKVGNEIQCNYSISGTSNLNDPIKEYQQIFDEAFDLKEKILRLEKELEETKALYLWEQA